ncbi:hypothetical protein U9M48_001890 [Paspalum notatum var. saurae]|uniref:Uncharacterized protein n=1 Tax=Paspalum notatum var. saurae TaxID=547442 RepID=A0AAQ3SH18_PASNO
MVGRSVAFSCTQSKAMLMHLIISGNKNTKAVHVGFDGKKTLRSVLRSHIATEKMYSVSFVLNIFASPKSEILGFISRSNRILPALRSL